MPAPARVAIAAAIMTVGIWLSGRVRHLVALVATNPARLGFEMMGIEVGLAAVAIAIAVALPGPTTRRLGLGPSRLPASAVIALALGTLGLSQALDAALSFTRALEHSVVVGISRGLEAARGRDFAIALLGTVVAPAIGEELLCRGLLQRGLALWIRPVAAIAISSLFFGWLHMELVHGALAACIGLYLGFAAYWADSTRPAIAGHALNNFAALLGSSGVAAVMLPPVPGLITGLAVAAFGIVWARHAGPLGEGLPAAGEIQPERGPADA
jgi:membrane protease YdiL (CAAX protease family)